MKGSHHQRGSGDHLALIGIGHLALPQVLPVSLSVAIKRPSSECDSTMFPASATPRLSTPQQATAPAQS